MLSTADRRISWPAATQATRLVALLLAAPLGGCLFGVTSQPAYAQIDKVSLVKHAPGPDKYLVQYSGWTSMEGWSIWLDFTACDDSINTGGATAYSYCATRSDRMSKRKSYPPGSFKDTVTFEWDEDATDSAYVRTVIFNEAKEIIEAGDSSPLQRAE